MRPAQVRGLQVATTYKGNHSANIKGNVGAIFSWRLNDTADDINYYILRLGTDDDFRNHFSEDKSSLIIVDNTTTSYEFYFFDSLNGLARSCDLTAEGKIIFSIQAVNNDGEKSKIKRIVADLRTNITSGWGYGLWDDDAWA